MPDPDSAAALGDLALAESDADRHEHISQIPAGLRGGRGHEERDQEPAEEGLIDSVTRDQIARIEETLRELARQENGSAAAARPDSAPEPSAGEEPEGGPGEEQEELLDKVTRGQIAAIEKALWELAQDRDAARPAPRPEPAGNEGPEGEPADQKEELIDEVSRGVVAAFKEALGALALKRSADHAAARGARPRVRQHPAAARQPVVRQAPAPGPRLLMVSMVAAMAILTLATWLTFWQTATTLGRVDAALDTRGSGDAGPRTDPRLRPASRPSSAGPATPGPSRPPRDATASTQGLGSRGHTPALPSPVGATPRAPASRARASAAFRSRT